MAAQLPKIPFQLRGGCFCRSIRYTISVPALEDRRELPQAPASLDRMLVPVNEVNARMPIISLDHCRSCRGVPGAILGSWVICPPEWVTFELQPLDTEKDTIKKDAMSYLETDKSLADQTTMTHFQSSENTNRTFCGKCGTHLTFYKSGPASPMKQLLGPFFDISTGTLDKACLEMEGLVPGMQVWDQEGIPWVVKLVAEGKKGLLVQNEVAKES